MAKILVVDDRAVDRELLVTLLGYAGHELLEASDGAEALHMAVSERPNLVIADLLMPTMDGFELVRQLRTNPVTAQMPVIFYTASYLQYEARSLAESCGVRHLLLKPSDPEVILNTVSEALGTHPPSAPVLEEFHQQHLQQVSSKLSRKLDVIIPRMAALIEIGQSLAREFDSEHMLERFCQETRDILGAKYAAIGLLGDEGKTLRRLITSGFNSEEVARIGLMPTGRGLLGQLSVELGSFRVTNIASDSRSVGFPANHPLMKSLLCAPILSPTTHYGWVYFTDKLSADEFSEEDEQIAAMLAVQIAVAYENALRREELLNLNAELEQRVVERTAELRRTNEALEYEVVERIRIAEQIMNLQKVTTAFSAALTSPDVAEVMVRQGFKIVGARRGAVFALSEDERFLKLIRAKDCTLKQIYAWQNVPLFDSSGALALCVQTKQMLWNLAQEHLISHVVTSSANGGRIRSTTWAVVPLMVHNRIIGVLALGFPKSFRLDTEKMSFVDTIAEQCAQALHRAQLHEQVQVAAALEERQRLARDLHDAVSQTLFSANMIAEALPRLWLRNPDSALQRLSELARLVSGASAEMRTLLIELRPTALVNMELDVLIMQLIKAIQGRKRIEFSVTIDKPCYPLPTDVHIAFYRIAQEALNNIVKHASATHVTVQLSSTPDGVDLRIRDNGSGFDMQNYHAGLGLGMMGERAEAVGANFQLESGKGQGTEIRVSRATHAPAP